MARAFVTLLICVITSAQWIVAENLLMNHHIMQGFIFPTSVTVAVGESVHLKIVITMDEGDRCLYREPGSDEDVDVHAPVTFRRQQRIIPVNASDETRDLNVEATECGIKVLNVNHEDAGFWRLTMMRGAQLIRGISMVNVIDVPTVPDTSDRDSIVGLEEITPAGTDYCYVLRDSDTQTKDVPMYEQCSLEVSEMDPTGTGHWNVIAGVQGYMREMHFAINIEHKDEQIETSIHRGATFHVLMCNLRYSRMMIRFCRFVRVADNQGLNMLQGVGWDRYRYYGNGFDTGDCGLEIEDPDTIDKGLWKCLVGYGNDEMMKVSGAIMDTGDWEADLAIISAEDVNVLNGTEMTLQCNANKPLDYCWFRDQHGEIYSVSEGLPPAEDAHFWYSGISLSLGDCGIRLKPVTEEMAGQWSCHVGSSKYTPLEVSTRINVRVGLSQIFPMAETVVATLEGALVVECSSIPKNTPFQYCRFVAPSGQAFSLDESITVDQAILDNYYSNPSHEPKKGFCSLVIKNVTTADLGEWICAGKITGHSMEHYTKFEITVLESRMAAAELTVASIVGMAIGGAIMLLGAAGLGYYNFRRRLKRQTAAVNHEIELEARSIDRQAVERFSIASRSSDGSHGSQRSDNQLRNEPST
ncbi:uncharacterized protein LOC135708308 [Ochlerotatus camptorhynchus]|uniref:uncharacterized protein LOC135708308 n=1 Tax=Ochlerotatus camptorhynchus TaxID=644619 RepID=UPI0031D32627